MSGADQREIRSILAVSIGPENIYTPRSSYASGRRLSDRYTRHVHKDVYARIALPCCAC